MEISVYSGGRPPSLGATIRFFLMIVGTFAAIVCNEGRADAQNYPYASTMLGNRERGGRVLWGKSHVPAPAATA